MQQVLATIEALGGAFAKHPLHRWLASGADAPPVERRLWSGLCSTSLIMEFSDLNRYHVSYGARRDSDPYKEALSVHADEDMTHSRLLLQDFHTLNWDGLLGWRPSETLSWLFYSTANEGMRRRSAELASIAVQAGDPAVRYAVVEATERAGNALFTAFTAAANRYTAATGRNLVYWGEEHLAKETGHTLVGEDVFEELNLDQEQREQATTAAARVFGLWDDNNRDMLLLAQRVISQAGFASLLATDPVVDGIGQSPTDVVRSDLLNATQQPIYSALAEQVRLIREAAAAALGGAGESMEAETSIATLRGILPYLAVCDGFARAVHQYVAPYRTPFGPAQRAICRLAQTLTPAQSSMFVDWTSLELDRGLAWPVTSVLEFVYLDPSTKPLRDLRALLVNSLAGSDDPTIRYWAMVAYHQLTCVYREAVARLAQQLPDHTDHPLPYLSGTATTEASHEYVGQFDDPEVDGFVFESVPVTDETAKQCVTVVEDISAAIISVLRSWATATVLR